MEPATHECGILVNERAAARLAKTEMARKWLSWEPAGRVGLNAGLALAGLNIVNWLIGLAAGGAFANTLGQDVGFINPSTERLAFFAGCVLFLARLALFFLVGLRVTRRTGVVSRGVLAGIVAGAVDGVSGMVVTLLGIVFFPVYTLTAGFTAAAQPVGSAVLVTGAQAVALVVVGALLAGIGGGSRESDRIPGAA